MAREAGAFDVIAAAGGDGTLNAVVNGVFRARESERPIFALLPLGTANVLARELGLPHRRRGNAETFAALIAEAEPRPIWPGRVGDRLFVTMASAGFDAQTVAAVNPWFKRRFGRLAFVWAFLVCLARYRPADLTVRVDNIDYRAAGIVAAKGRFYAGSYVIAPAADLTMPILDLVLFRRSGRVAVLRYLLALLRGRLTGLPDVTRVHGQAIFVIGPASIPVQADGEVVSRLPAPLGIATEPLHFIAPMQNSSSKC